MKKVVSVACTYAVLFACGFTQKPAVAQGIKSDLLRVDRALQSCIQTTLTEQPMAIEATRAAELREKIFFALESHRGAQKKLERQSSKGAIDEIANSEENLRSVMREIRNAYGLGESCHRLLSQLKLKPTTRQSGAVL